jgi:nitrogen regulatory protein PII
MRRLGFGSKVVRIKASNVRGDPILSRDSVVESAVAAIVKAGKTGEIGDGKVFVSTIDEAVRIRTEETGERAL